MTTEPAAATEASPGGAAAAEAPKRILRRLRERGAIGTSEISTNDALNITFLATRTSDEVRQQLEARVRILRRELFQAEPGAPLFVVLLTPEDRRALPKLQAAVYDPARNTLTCASPTYGQLDRSHDALRELVRALELWPQLGVARALLLRLY